MCINHEDKQVCWNRACVSTNEPGNREEFVTLMNKKAAAISKTMELPGDK